MEKLGHLKRRSPPLLKTLAFHLSKSAKDLTSKDISDCLFAMKELSFKDKVRF